MKMARPLLPLLIAGVLVGSGCVRDGTTEALLALDEFADPRVGELRNVRVELVVTKPDGDPASGSVDVAGESYAVESPFPMGCNGVSCRLAVRLTPGEYDFSLHLYAADQCGDAGKIIELRPEGTVQVDAGLTTQIDFTRESFNFDDDSDGIPNVFELLTCGRIKAFDDDRRWSECAVEDDPCCTSGQDPRIGIGVFFDALTYDGPDGEQRFVDALYMDATEVTFGTLRRCVAAGVCLANAPDHPAWAKVVADDVDDDFPASGLSPADAQTLCTWLDKALPTPEQWDRVAAGRPDGSRTRFPWGDDDDIGCNADDPEAVVANHRAFNRACPRAPLPVGRYGSSDVVGTPIQGIDTPPRVADLGGNLAEWTLSPAGVGEVPRAEIPEVPAGTRAVQQHGGGFDSISFFLENSEPVVLPMPELTDDVTAAERSATIRRLMPVTGFRCVSTTPPVATAKTCAED